jgi:acetyl esterase/lipase
MLRTATLLAVTALLSTCGAVRSETVSASGPVVINAGNYGSQDNEGMTIFSPDGKVHPTILFVHGGGWDRGTINQAEVNVAENIEAYAKWNVAVINYPVDVTPYRTSEPAAIHQALVYLKTQPTTGAHVDLWGESAGGNLALLTAYNYPTLVDGVVSISGPTDMTAEWNNISTQLLVQTYEQATPSGAGDSRYTTTSPADVVASGAPATFQAVGSADPLVPSSEITEQWEACAAVAAQHRTYILAGDINHATDLEPDVPSGQTEPVYELGVDYLKTLD